MPRKVACVACQDAGFVLAEDSRTALATYQAGALVPCPACSRGMSPARDHFARLDPYQHQATTLERARALAMSDNPVGWLIITGGYGSGKSTLLEALARTLGSRGLHARKLTAPALRTQIYAAFREGSYGGWLESLKRARVLVIDEIDSVKWSDQNVEEAMSELLNARYERAHATLTVLAGADLGAMPGRILSRMRDFGACDLGATDLRQSEGGAWDTGEAAAWDRGE